MRQNYGATLLKRRANSFIMEPSSGSPIGDSRKIPQSWSWGGRGAPAMANAGSGGEHVSEGAERVRKDRAKVNKQVMKLEEATAAVHQDTVIGKEKKTPVTPK